MNNKALIEKLKEALRYEKDCIIGMYEPIKREQFDEEIASLESQQEKSIPSDEDIDKESGKQYPYSDYEWNKTTELRKAFFNGAKAMRDNKIPIAPQSNH